jgi:flagellar hook protein FlgE
MLTSFSTALSALNAATTAIDVTGNNLANLNTTGYKDSTVSFFDLMSQTLSNGSQVGVGVGTPITQANFTQGAIQADAAPLDGAIQGNGFFVVTGANGQTQYTRDGTFQINASGNLATPTGELVQGWSQTNGVVNTNSPVGDLTVPLGALTAPVATTSASVNLNLDAAETTPGTPNTFTTSLQVYDSLGTAHTVSFTFTQTATPNQWNYSMAFPNGDLTAAGTPLTGTLTFDSSGNLTTPAATDPPLVLNAAGLSDGAADMNITWNLYTGTTPDMTQFAQASATSSQSQNGSPPASLSNVSLGNGGQLLAQYSDGSQVVVGQLAMAGIGNPQSLISVGDNDFQLGANTAAPTIGIPGTGGLGTILGASLESSTVDIATEFTNLIVFQRAYEASAKVITTADQMSQDTIAIKQ